MHPSFKGSAVSGEYGACKKEVAYKVPDLLGVCQYTKGRAPRLAGQACRRQHPSVQVSKSRIHPEHNVHISAVRVSRFLQFCLSVFAQVRCDQVFDQAIVLAQITKESGKLCTHTGAIPLKTFDFRLQKR